MKKYERLIARKNGENNGFEEFDGNWRSSPTRPVKTLESFGRKNSDSTNETLKQDTPRADGSAEEVRQESPIHEDGVFTFAKTKPTDEMMLRRLSTCSSKTDQSGIQERGAEDEMMLRRLSTCSAKTDQSEIQELETELPLAKDEASEEHGKEKDLPDTSLDFEQPATKKSGTGMEEHSPIIAPLKNPRRLSLPQDLENLSLSSPQSRNRKFSKPSRRTSRRWSAPESNIWKEELLHAVQESQKKDVEIPEDIASRFMASA